MNSSGGIRWPSALITYDAHAFTRLAMSALEYVEQTSWYDTRMIG